MEQHLQVVRCKPQLNSWYGATLVVMQAADSLLHNIERLRAAEWMVVLDCV